MKRILFAILLLISVRVANSQTTYYWVGGPGLTSFTSNANWNTALNGSGTARGAAAGTDILVFDGSNIGGAVPATGNVTVSVTSTNFAQIKVTNNANVTIQRPVGGGGTGTLTVNGGVGDDFVVDAGSSLSINSSVIDGNVIFTFNAAATGLINGSYTIMNTGTHRMNLPTAGALVFASGSSFTSNLTGAASYPFGSNSQSAARAAVFQSGANLYYNGGYSPMGNNSAFMAIDMQPGSNWYHRATNAITGFGSFFNTKYFGNIIVENGATLACDGPVYRIGNLTINNGCGFTTHSSGQTAVLGNMTVDGSFAAPGGSSNALVLGGNSLQTISGTGTITTPNLVVGDNASILLNKNITVLTSSVVYGKMDFSNSTLSGAATFTAKVADNAAGVTGNLVAGSYQVTGVIGTLASINGLTISGAGIDPGTTVVGFSGTNMLIALSKPIAANGTAVALTFASDTATLATTNANGFADATGSVQVADNKIYQSGINYIISGATTTPFGVTTGSTNTFINAGFVEVNAPVTVNKKVNILSRLTINGKITLNPLDTIHITSGAFINGTFNSSNYIATGYNTAGEQSVLQYDGLATTTTFPVGTSSYYMPVTITPVNSSDFTVAVYEGITTNGTITGTPFNATQKQTVVNAAWNINRLNGTGDATLQLGWDGALEGSTFATLPNTDIGLITNNGAIWAPPIGTGDNTANIVTATVSSFGAFGAGAVAQVDPFVFNAIPTKMYGDADFNGGATSLNTTQPIVYSSSNPAVATIIGSQIHIVSAGTSDITASQASDGFYPAASITRTLTVNKASLTITADNKTRFEGAANPPLTATYTGFVLSETPVVLLTPAVLSTPAVLASAPGTYPITVSGATAANYTITFVNGVLTVQAKQNQTITFATPATKTYGNANFSAAASSTNNTIPLTYASSNTGVANINSSGIISITGAGTTNITVSQAGNDGYFPAPSVTRTLTVNKANLTIRVRDTTKVVGEPNPPFTITYTGFVLGETAANLTTAPSVSTIATASSAPGYYTLTVSGAVSSNYNFIYTNGRLTILPASGTAQQYMNAFMSNSSTFTVRVYSPTPSLGDIIIFDMSGKPLIRRNLFMPAGFINMDIPVYHLPAGLYIVTIKGDGVDLKKTILK